MAGLKGHIQIRPPSHPAFKRKRIKQEHLKNLWLLLVFRGRFADSYQVPEIQGNHVGAVPLPFCPGIQTPWASGAVQGLWPGSGGSQQRGWGPDRVWTECFWDAAAVRATGSMVTSGQHTLQRERCSSEAGCKRRPWPL